MSTPPESSIRVRTIVYLAVLARPGVSAPEVASDTGLDPRSVRKAMRALERRGLVFTRIDEGGPNQPLVAYGVPPPDRAAAARLRELLTPAATPSRADIQVVS